MKSIILICLIISVLSDPSCSATFNLCLKCDIDTNLCEICQNDALIPDEDGGCIGKKSCTTDLNYCLECDEDNLLCDSCEEGFYPDENGGCSSTENCEVSYLGECVKCGENYILYDNKTKTNFTKECKSLLDSEEYMNCKEIDFRKGVCKKCEDDFFLNGEDKKCIETQFCDVSSFGKCDKCKKGYYLDHSDGRKCKTKKDKKNSDLFYCSETEDGKSCSKCQDGYYFDLEDKCAQTNYCSKSIKSRCQKCIDEYYLAEDKKTCVSTENCKFGNTDTGICFSCN